MITFSNLSGKPHNTSIVNAETGEDLSKTLLVESAVLNVDRDGTTAVCKLAMLQVDLTANKTQFRTLNPLTGKYEDVGAIEFRDGSRVEIAEDGTPSVVAKA